MHRHAIFHPLLYFFFHLLEVLLAIFSPTFAYRSGLFKTPLDAKYFKHFSTQVEL